MEFALTILGVNGATPAYGRFPTAQFLQIQNHHFLIDCGEGAQMRLSKYGLPKGKINHIFISHLHGDHIFGLPGLLFSYALNNRSLPLNIYAPPGLKEMILAQLNPGGQLPYPVHFHEVNTREPRLLLDNEQLQVHSFPLKHRVPTCGYLFKEKPFRININPLKIKEFDLKLPQIKSLIAGKDLQLADGRVLKNKELTLPPYQIRSYAFVSDSVYDESIVPFIKAASLLYHETTFCEDARENAAKTLHSTAKQAASIALKAEVGQLITGHYSSRYKEVDIFKEEAQLIFKETLLGEEGKTYRIERVRVQSSS